VHGLSGRRSPPQTGGFSKHPGGDEAHPQLLANGLHWAESDADGQRESLRRLLRTP
jgi:hypothetical protein